MLTCVLNLRVSTTPFQTLYTAISRSYLPGLHDNGNITVIIQVPFFFSFLLCFFVVLRYDAGTLTCDVPILKI